MDIPPHLFGIKNKPSSGGLGATLRIKGIRGYKRERGVGKWVMSCLQLAAHFLFVCVGVFLGARVVP